MKFLVPILLLSLNARADKLVERLCFNSAAQAGQAIPILNMVLIKGQDEIQPEGNCLNVLVEEKRGELFERWVQARLPDARTEFSTRNAPATHCEMDLEKKTFREEIVTQYGASGKVVGVVAGQDTLQDEETTFLKMTSGKPSLIQLNQEHVEVTCTRKASGRFQMKIALKTLPRELPNIYNPSDPIKVMPPNAQALSTEVETGPGEAVNLGEIIKDLTRNQQSVELPPGFTKTRTLGEEKTTWTLKIR